MQLYSLPILISNNLDCIFPQSKLDTHAESKINSKQSMRLHQNLNSNNFSIDNEYSQKFRFKIISANQSKM
jgi:hypothetical protein